MTSDVVPRVIYIYNDGLWWFMVDNINDDS